MTADYRNHHPEAGLFPGARFSFIIFATLIFFPEDFHLGLVHPGHRIFQKKSAQPAEKRSGTREAYGRNANLLDTINGYATPCFIRRSTKDYNQLPMSGSRMLIVDKNGIDYMDSLSKHRQNRDQTQTKRRQFPILLCVFCIILYKLKSGENIDAPSAGSGISMGPGS
jgi:hypothetical protein